MKNTMMCLWKSFLRPVNLPRVNQSELSHKGLNLGCLHESDEVALTQNHERICGGLDIILFPQYQLCGPGIFL